MKIGFRLPLETDASRETCAAVTRPTVSCEMPDATPSCEVMLSTESAAAGSDLTARLVVHPPAEPAG